MVSRCLVVGFQSSGKTTYAAALWHLLDSREVETKLVKGKHVGDFRYLEEMAQLWGEGWQVERTKSTQIEPIRINLVDPVSGAELELDFTDLSGETFDKAFATRLCPPTLVSLVNQASSVLLFVTADRVIDDVTILDALDGEDAGDAPQDEDEGDDTPWDPKKTPLQVQIVDLLQALRLPPFENKATNVAVIVSAWDLSDQPSAKEWLANKMPLLDQYLSNRDAAIDLRVYGVSAQGGQLSKKGTPPSTDRQRLLDLDRSSDRIQITGPEVQEHDLTCPLHWLIGVDLQA